jgi:hypothetical protein
MHSLRGKFAIGLISEKLCVTLRLPLRPSALKNATNLRKAASNQVKYFPQALGRL